MKKHFGLKHYFVFALAATLCMPAHAMWRQAGQKVSAAVTSTIAAAARQARLGATTLGSATKNLQKALYAPRGAQTMARVQATMPEVRPSTTRFYTDTYLKNIATAQPLSTTKQALLTAKQVVVDTTAIGAGVATAHSTEKYAENHTLNEEARMLNKFDISNIQQYSVEFINKYYQKILEHYPTALNTLTDFAIKNFAQMSTNVLLDLLEKQPAAAKKFTIPASKDISTVDSEIIKEILEKNPAAAETFASAALASHDQAPLATLLVITHANQRNKELFTALKTVLAMRLPSAKKENHLDYLATLNLLNFSAKTAVDNNLLPESITPTEAHILSVPGVVEKNSRYFTNQRLKKMVVGIIGAEHDHQQDYYTFVHGQRWEYLLAEKFFTDLWGCRHGKQVKDFLFAHVRNKEDDATEEKLHSRLLTKGRSLLFGDCDARQHLLFLNAALFGNTYEPGSSTAMYFLSNTNVSSLSMPLKRAFELHGYGDIYEQHQQEINNLQKEYQALNDGHGNILFVAVPKKLAKEYVYPAASGGYKFSKLGIDDETMDFLIHPEKQTNSWVTPKAVDHVEFCLIMCKEAMNPESGIKVKAFNTVDPEKMAAFWKKYDGLMNRVKTDIEAKMAGKPLPSLQPDDTVLERYQELFA